jgi:hypothetical protein
MEKRGNTMKKSLYIKPLGVPLGKFIAEVEVVATNIITGNILIKAFPASFKELEFSDEEKCWNIKNEMLDLPDISENSDWRRIVKGIKDETPVCAAVSIQT